MKLITRLAIIAMLLLPLFGVGMQNYSVEQEIWIVTTDTSDIDLNLAISTFRHQIANTHIGVNEILLSEIGTLESDVDALVIVGHGQPDGLETSDGIIPWSELYDRLQEFKPQMMMMLACYSPSYPEERVFGFTGQIDAEAGAILSAYVVGQTLGISDDISISTERILESQQTMLHPLESVLYFVHGYFGDTESWTSMVEYLLLEGELPNYDHVRYFNYSEYWLNENPDWDIYDVHTERTIYNFATRFFQDIISEGYSQGTQIDIVAHSMGGLITRELLRVYRSMLQTNYAIDVGRVVTLGTPHAGTYLGDGSIPSELIALLQGWSSPLLHSMSPTSDFITALNTDPLSYSDNIIWTTISGVDNVLGWILNIFHGGWNDVIVAVWSAHLSFSNKNNLTDLDHEGLLVNPTNGDPGRPFGIVAEALGPEIDSDNDGLSDIEEKWVYGTNPDDSDSDNDGLNDNLEVNTYDTDPNDSDSDNDGLNDYQEVLVHFTDPNDSDTDGDSLSDYVEIHTHSTNPTLWSTDGDMLSDGQEIAWGYDPCDSNDPIPASSLIYISRHSAGKVGYVYANHYAAMDYIKVYVRYRFSAGYWTGFSYVGSDYTPYSSGDYYVSWGLLPGTVRMQVRVEAYDSSNHYLGSDSVYVTLPDDGGGDPPPL